MTVTILQTQADQPRAYPRLMMSVPDNRRYVAARSGVSVTARVARFQTDIASRVATSTRSVLHVLGAHCWREGYETDLEKGWSRYRGSRCTICDSPWEGW